MNKTVSLISRCPAVHAGPLSSPALPGEVSPQFTHISVLVPGFSIDTNGRALCSGLARLYSSSQTVEMTIELQKSSGSGWAEVTTWCDKGPGFPGVNLERAFYITRGTYRVCVTAKAYSESGVLLETASQYSHAVTY